MKHLLLRETDVLKACRKSKFVRNFFCRNALALKSKNVENLYGETFFWYCWLQLSFVCKTMSQISFNLFFPKDKRVLSEFSWKWGWFQEHNEHFSKYLPKSRISKNWNMVFLMKEHWKQRHWYFPVTGKPVYLFACKRKYLRKGFLTPIVNYRKIIQKNKSCHPKQR